MTFSEASASGHEPGENRVQKIMYKNFFAKTRSS